MRLSLFISILIHLLIIWAILFLFRVVPEIRLPEKVYTVKILQPIMRARRAEPEKKAAEELEKAEVKKPTPAKPKKKKEKEEKPAETKAKEKPLDVSVQKEQAGTALTIDAPRFPFSYYLEAVERKVSQNWFSAVSPSGEGLTCVVYFRLGRDGRIADARVEKSSGNVYFDRAALRAVKSSAPFPPLPRAFSDPYLGIHFTFLQRD